MVAQEEHDTFLAERGSVWRFLSAQACASVGAIALTTVLGLQVWELTRRELSLGFLGLVEFLPALLLVLVTGTVADRFDRRRIASLGLLLQTVVAATLGWYAMSDPTSAAPIFALVLCFGVARAFTAPAVRSMPADLVPYRRLPWLTVRYSATWQVSAIVGPVLGGVLYAVDPVAPFFVVAGLFLAASFVITTVRYAAHVHDVRAGARTALAEPLDAMEPAELEDAELTTPAAPPASVRERVHEAMEGFRFIRREPVLLGAITLDLMAVLFGGALALLPALAEERLGVGAVGLGWLRAAVGIGAALMTLALAIRPVQRRIGVVLLVAVAMFGVGTVALGVTTSFAVAFVALMVASAADAISVFIRSTLVPLVTPDEMRGRVLAVEMVLIGASNELGAFESGVTGQLFGPAIAVVMGGGASVVVAVVWWFAFPALRRTDRFPRMEPSPPDESALPAPVETPPPQRG
ncbi:MAG: MFS transporter [Actinobacteria bacterium]|nr:MFS transporter [Actinomycetota bacterium]